MAYTIEVGSILEIQYRYAILDQQCINSFHYKNQQLITDGAAAASEAANAWYAKFGGALQLLQTTDVNQMRVRAQWVHPTRYVHRTMIPATAIGDALSPTLSIGTSAVIRRRSNLAGVSNRGRIYLAGLPVSSADVGMLTPGTVTLLDSEIAQKLPESLFVEVGTVELAPVIWSYTDPLNAVSVESGDVDTVLRYQRRREVGQGI